MIQIEKLKNVKKIVVHKFCHDGTTSAMIIRDVLHDVEVFFAGHKDKEYLELKAEEGLLFCDISPPPGRHDEFINKGSIVLDHHVKHKDIIKEFESLGLGAYGETDDGVSGAVLAYENVWLPLEENAKTEKHLVYRLAKLAGVKDTFQTNSDDWNDAEIQIESVAFYPSEHFLTNHPATILPNEWEIGEIIAKRNKEIVKRVSDSAFILHWNNSKVAIIPGHKIISDAAETLRKRGVPITLAFTFRVDEFGTPTMTVSCRSDGTFDCNKFASMFGGGGHVCAAGGLTVDIKDETLNPYTVINRILIEHGKECLIK